MDLTSSVVWVTGASSGIGEAIAVQFARKGAKLVLSGRNATRLNATLEKVEKYSDAACVAFDIAHLSAERAAELSSTALSHFGRIDYMVHAAGISNRGAVVDTNFEVFERVMDINFLGVVALTKAILPHMLESKRKSGFIVISSVQGKLGLPNRGPYSASKHAIQGFFDGLRAEVAHKGVDVLIVCPGYVRTRLSLNALSASGDEHGVLDETTKNGYSPKHVAKCIYDAATSGKSEIVIADFTTKFAIFLKHWFPWLLNYILNKRAIKAEKTV